MIILQTGSIEQTKCPTRSLSCQVGRVVHFQDASSPPLNHVLDVQVESHALAFLSSHLQPRDVE